MPLFSSESLPPIFLNGELSRGSDHVNVTWRSVGKQGYDVRLSSSRATDIIKGVKPPVEITGLVSNANYDLSVSEADSGIWGNTLLFCTRPPRPEGFEVGANDVTVPTVVLVWDFKDIISTAETPASIDVSIGRMNANGALIVVSTHLTPQGRYIDIGRHGLSSYSARLSSQNLRAPDGENISEWGSLILVRKNFFGSLKVPGPNRLGQRRVIAHMGRFRA
jgi:hypothetical protein